MGVAMFLSDSEIADIKESVCWALIEGGRLDEMDRLPIAVVSLFGRVGQLPGGNQLYREIVKHGFQHVSAGKQATFKKMLAKGAKDMGLSSSEQKTLIDYAINSVPGNIKRGGSHYGGGKGSQPTTLAASLEVGLGDELAERRWTRGSGKGKKSGLKRWDIYVGNTNTGYTVRAHDEKGAVREFWKALGVSGSAEYHAKHKGRPRAVLAEDVDLVEAAPPGWAGTVKAMKKHMPADKAFALAWTGYKKGHEPHYKDIGSTKSKKKPEKKARYQDEGRDGAVYDFNDAGMFADEWKQKYHLGEPSMHRLSRMANRRLLYKLIDDYKKARGSRGPLLVSRTDATAIRSLVSQLLKDTGKYGGVPAKIAAEKALLKEILDEIQYAMKHPEQPRTEGKDGCPCGNDHDSCGCKTCKKLKSKERKMREATYDQDDDDFLDTPGSMGSGVGDSHERAVPKTPGPIGKSNTEPDQRPELSAARGSNSIAAQLAGAIGKGVSGTGPGAPDIGALDPDRGDHDANSFDWPDVVNQYQDSIMGEDELDADDLFALAIAEDGDLAESVSLPAEVMAIADFLTSKRGEVGVSELRRKHGMTEKWAKKLLALAKVAFRGAGVPRADIRRRESDPARYFREKVHPVLVAMHQSEGGGRSKGPGLGEAYAIGDGALAGTQAIGQDAGYELPYSMGGNEGLDSEAIVDPLAAAAAIEGGKKQDNKTAKMQTVAPWGIGRASNPTKYTAEEKLDARKIKAALKWVHDNERSSTNKKGIGRGQAVKTAISKFKLDGEEAGVLRRATHTAEEVELAEAKPKRISKNFRKLSQAESFQNRLYGRYDRVRLVRSPRFGEEGTYAWEVGEASHGPPSGSYEHIDDYPADDRIRMAEAYDRLVGGAPDLSKEELVDAEKYKALVTKHASRVAGQSNEPASARKTQVPEEVDLDDDPFLGEDTEDIFPEVLEAVAAAYADRYAGGEKLDDILADLRTERKRLTKKFGHKLGEARAKFDQIEKNLAFIRKVLQRPEVSGMGEADEAFEDALVMEGALAEAAGHHFFDGKDYYADTAFMNNLHGVVKGMEMSHLGFGEFVLKGAEGEVDFDRMRGKDFPGQSGRSHKLYDNKSGKLVKKIVKAMEKARKSELVTEDADWSGDILGEGAGRAKERQAWMRRMQSALLKLAPKKAGKIDWDTATHLFNVGDSPEEAAKKMAKLKYEGLAGDLGFALAVA